MEYEKIPLEEQLRRAASKFIVHPEYTSCAIREWAGMPIAAYLGGGSEAGMERREQFRRLMGLPPKKLEAMTYREAMEELDALCRQEPPDICAERALFLLAEPLAEAWERYQGGGGCRK